MGKSSRAKQERRSRPTFSVEQAGLVTSLRGIENRYATIWPSWIKDLDSLKALRGRDPAFNWPDWCLVPVGLTNNLVKLAATAGCPEDQNNSGEPAMGLRITSEVAAMYAWRQGKGIYYFDETLAAALLETEGTDMLPVEALMHLPEWGICIPVPRALEAQLPGYGTVDICGNGK